MDSTVQDNLELLSQISSETFFIAFAWDGPFHQRKYGMRPRAVEGDKVEVYVYNNTTCPQVVKKASIEYKGYFDLTEGKLEKGERFFFRDARMQPKTYLLIHTIDLKHLKLIEYKRSPEVVFSGKIKVEVSLQQNTCLTRIHLTQSFNIPESAESEEPHINLLVNRLVQFIRNKKHCFFL